MRDLVISEHEDMLSWKTNTSLMQQQEFQAGNGNKPDITAK